jgi:S1-C subfamily serine protease
MDMRRVAMRHRIEIGTVAALVLAWAMCAEGHAAVRRPAVAGRAAAGQKASVHEPGYLGIGFHDLTEEQASALRLKGNHGVEVLLVDHDGPAGKSGLRPHDVITSLNGQTVANAELLRKMIHEMGVGASIKLGVLRNGQMQTVSVQLAERADVEREARLKIPSPDALPPVDGDGMVSGFMESYTIEPAPAPAGNAPSFLELMLHMTPFTGLGMETMEPQLAGFFGAPAGMGLLVQMVIADSPASLAGLRAGDVVLRVDGVGLHSTSEWMKRLKASKGQPMSLTVLREKHEMTVTLTPVFKKHASLEWPAVVVLGGAFFSA